MPWLIFGEDEGPIADHLVARPGGVAGVAQIQRGRAQFAPVRRRQQSTNRDATAGPLRTNVPRPKIFNRLGSCTVQLSRGGVVVIMAQVRADHQARLWSAPEPVDDFCDRVL